MLFCFLCKPSFVFAQNSIKLYGESYNKIDKKNRKQGNWIFFDTSANVELTTYYEDDKISSPLVFYKNSDTVFIRLPKKNNYEDFIYYKDNLPVSGSFVYTTDSLYTIEIDAAYINDTAVLNQVRYYRQLKIRPIYMFGQKKMADYISAAFFSSNYFFNKNIYAVLYISSSGIVTKVDFPADKNNLHSNEEIECRHIYESMPRWQPLFVGDNTKACRIVLTHNTKITDFY